MKIQMTNLRYHENQRVDRRSITRAVSILMAKRLPGSRDGRMSCHLAPVKEILNFLWSFLKIHNIVFV